MALTNEQITAKNFKEFYEQIRPYLNGSFPTPVANKMSRGDLYSTNERMIGQWIDGKPLYQKTIQTTVGSTATQTIAHGVSNIGFAMVKDAILLNSGSYYDIDIDNHFSECSIDGMNLTIKKPTASSYSGNDIWFVIKYTKSTDTAIKMGRETDYSEDEQIIGTWIDGKPLYQKTINSGAIPNNTNKTIELDIPNIGRVLNIFGYAYVGTGTASPRSIHLPFISSAGHIDIEIRNGNNLFISDNANFSVFTESYITIQYLKTTD